MDQKLSVPATIEGITKDWLAQALAPHLGGGTIMSANVSPFAEPGQTAQIAEIHLEVSPKVAGLPDRLIAKLAALEPEVREVMSTFDMYEREVGFYRYFGGTDLPLPKSYHAAFDAETGMMVLLLEHLAPARSPSWGITQEQFQHALEELARIHASNWNEPAIRSMKELNQLDDRTYWQSNMDLALGSFEAVRAKVGDRASHQMQIIQLCAQNLDAFIAFFQQRSFTLRHCDYHGKQMFFPHQGQGRFAIIDWQYPGTGPGAWDLMRALTCAMSTPDRRAKESGIVARYLSDLKRFGVENYGADDFDADAHGGIVLNIVINFAIVGFTDMSIMEREFATFGLDFDDMILDRGEALARDRNSVAFFEQLF